MRRILIATFLGLSLMIAAPSVHAATESQSLQNEIAATKKGLGGALDLFRPTAQKAGFPEGALPPEVVIGQLIRSAIVLMGVIFGVLVVYAGFLWLTARGSDDQVKRAKGILESATIGIVVVVAAYAITTFVVDKVINTTFQQGGIGGDTSATTCPTGCSRGSSGSCISDSNGLPCS